MAFQITGKIEVIGDVQTKPSKNGGQPFQSRELILDATRYNPETGEPWENHPRFDIGGSRLNIVSGLKVGQRVTVDFVLRGTKYVDQTSGEQKYFTSIIATKVTPIESQPQQAQASQASNVPFPQQSPEPVKGEDENADDLPF